MAEKKKIKIDDVSYDVDQLSEDARRHVGNLRIADEEIMRLKRHVAMLETARSSYAMMLRQALPTGQDAEKSTH